MGTRSTISYLYADGRISTIYCHFDGYLSGVGKELLDHYYSCRAVLGLIEFGNHSSIIAGHARAYFPKEKARTYYSKQNLLQAEEQEYNYLFNSVTKRWLVHIMFSQSDEFRELTYELIDK